MPLVSHWEILPSVVKNGTAVQNNIQWQALVLYMTQHRKSPSSSNITTHAFNGPFLGLLGWDGTRKIRPVWILLKQETVSGSGISWAICKTAPCSRQTRNSAIAEGLRDVSCQLKSCQLPCNSGETTCTTSPKQIELMELEGYSKPT